MKNIKPFTLHIFLKEKYHLLWSVLKRTYEISKSNIQQYGVIIGFPIFKLQDVNSKYVWLGANVDVEINTHMQ